VGQEFGAIQGAPSTLFNEHSVCFHYRDHHGGHSPNSGTRHIRCSGWTWRAEPMGWDLRLPVLTGWSVIYSVMLCTGIGFQLRLHRHPGDRHGTRRLSGGVRPGLEWRGARRHLKAGVFIQPTEFSHCHLSARRLLGGKTTCRNVDQGAGGYRAQPLLRYLHQARGPPARRLSKLPPANSDNGERRIFFSVSRLRLQFAPAGTRREREQSRPRLARIGIG